MEPSVDTRSPGALVLSLDFELHWGVRDVHPPDGPYRQNLLGARRAIPRLLALFEEFGVAATWATVGFLFARSREELERFSPRERPAYADPILSPYGEPVGEDEEEDPLHFAPSLIERIRASPRQEVGTHTFSHYYCLEQGQTRAAFQADLEAAGAIAARHGIRLHSIIFPRNQYNPAYDEVLLASGITAYRSNVQAWMYREATTREGITRMRRAGRLLDAYLNLSGHNTTGWSDLLQPNGLCRIPESALLRRYSPRLRSLEPLRLERIRRSLRFAARSGRIYHLWWHPHNFGAHTEENLAFLRAVLEEFARCREHYGMLSLAMCEVDRRARSDHGEAVRASGGRSLASPLYG